MEKKEGHEPLYTSGTWIVKPGKEKEFIDRWQDFAAWSRDNIAGLVKAHLLQDKEEPRKFESFGEWRDDYSIEQWRASKQFQDFMATMKQLCEEYMVHEMCEVANA